MKTYPTRNADGQVLQFEIDNVLISPRKIAALLRESGDVSDVQVRRPFSESPDVHVKFKYLGRDFVVWEPYGDSSRYWIGPKDKSSSAEIKDLQAIFDSYEPALLIKVFGALISLDPRTLFKGSRR